MATGVYNGWFPSLSYSTATRYASDPSTCDFQQNLDYLCTEISAELSPRNGKLIYLFLTVQMFNGWVLGRTGYELGSYQNLRVCRD